MRFLAYTISVSFHPSLGTLKEEFAKISSESRESRVGDFLIIALQLQLKSVDWSLFYVPC